MNKLRLAVVGVGRMGVFHAKHAQELGRESGNCELTAVVDTYENTAKKVAAELQKNQEREIRHFTSVEALLKEKLVDAAVVASKTQDHYHDSVALIDAGYRVMLEKPLTESVATAKQLAQYLNRDPWKKTALMQAFMRRFDEALRYAKVMLDEKKLGTPFKVLSVLEDPLPPPAGYNSPGIVSDMAVHNIDETLWLIGSTPEKVAALGGNLFNCKISPVKEDFDDAFLEMWFSSSRIGQVQVSRNHVAGYRNETWVFTEQGFIHVGAFEENPHQVTLVAYDKKGIREHKVFKLRDYGSNVPVFITRFGSAYREELLYFVEACLRKEPFSVTQEDGLNAIRVADAAGQALRTKDVGIPIPAKENL